MIKLLKFLKPYKWLLVAVILLAIGQSVANLYLPTLMSNIVTNGIAKFDTAYIGRMGIWMVLVTLVGAASAVVGIYYSSQIAVGMTKLIRAALFERVQLFSLHEFDQVSTASLITRTTNDTTQIQQVMVMILNLFVTAPITLVVGIILALNQDVGLSWVLIAILPFLVGTIIFLLIKAVPLFTKMQVKLDKLNLILDENLSGVRVIRAFDRISHEEKRFDAANLEVTDLAIEVNQWISIMMPVMMFLMNISSLAIIWFGSIRVASGNLDIGAMFAFLQYAIQILLSVLFVAIVFITIPRAEASAKRINEVMEIEPDIFDPKKPKKTGKMRGVVEFRNVTFSYHGAEKPALENISFVAAPGKVTAIIGGTGSGKSTMVNLIPRFYDVDRGAVLVDGIDAKELTQEELRSKIGFVPQKAYLFAGTVADNLRFGKENATEKEIEYAAKIAQASEFVSKMPEKFSSSIAQGGTNVSGGQMQRLSIARALVRKPEIYVFDDTFSALDFKTDARLRQALKNETKNSTVIIVAQRVSTVMDADQIIVLDEGKSVGIGSHKQLMKTCDVYRGIVSSQLSPEEIAKET
ncbi:ABC transporter ATP-binding protein/permease [Patescibacteria group bacterium]|nr:ABC transporter ATP-binding protein/permease [Patescibacteria group bacterium]